MGYNDLKKDGHWQWVNPSSACKKFTFWNRGEPNGKKRENCGQLYRHSGGRWNDLPCNMKLGSVCEIGTRAAKLCGPAKPSGGCR